MDICYTQRIERLLPEEEPGTVATDGRKYEDRVKDVSQTRRTLMCTKWCQKGTTDYYQQKYTKNMDVVLIKPAPKIGHCQKSIQWFFHMYHRSTVIQEGDVTRIRLTAGVVQRKIHWRHPGWHSHNRATGQTQNRCARMWNGWIHPSQQTAMSMGSPWCPIPRRSRPPLMCRETVFFSKSNDPPTGSPIRRRVIHFHHIFVQSKRGKNRLRIALITRECLLVHIDNDVLIGDLWMDGCNFFLGNGSKSTASAQKISP
jgi:hypothetical protein